YFTASALSTHVFSPLSLHDALPISRPRSGLGLNDLLGRRRVLQLTDCFLDLTCKWCEVFGMSLCKMPVPWVLKDDSPGRQIFDRSEEHTSELQSRENLVCRLLLGMI